MTEPAAPSPDALALIEYVGATADDLAFAQAKVAEASALVRQYVGSVSVPADVLDQAVLEVGSKLWARRRVQGNTGWGVDGMDATPVYAAKDPLVTVYATLAPWVGGGFA